MTTSTGRTASATQGDLSLTGRVIQGVTCPTLQLDDGSTVALSSLPAPFKIGDRVLVHGSGYAGSVSCMQEVFLVTAVEAASAN